MTSVFESVGDYHAAARVSDERAPATHAINRGIIAEGWKDQNFFLARFRKLKQLLWINSLFRRWFFVWWPSGSRSWDHDTYRKHWCHRHNEGGVLFYHTSLARIFCTDFTAI